MQIRYRFMGPQMTVFTKLCGTYPREWMTKLGPKKVGLPISMKSAPSALLLILAFKEWMENRAAIFLPCEVVTQFLEVSFIYVSKTHTCNLDVLPADGEHISELRGGKHLAVYFIIITSFNFHNSYELDTPSCFRWKRLRKLTHLSRLILPARAEQELKSMKSNSNPGQLTLTEYPCHSACIAACLPISFGLDIPTGIIVNNQTTLHGCISKLSFSKRSLEMRVNGITWSIYSSEPSSSTE